MSDAAGSDPRWYNGKLNGAWTIAGSVAGLIGLVALEAQTNWGRDRWDDVWPVGQLAAWSLLTVALGVGLVVVRTKLAASRSALSQSETDLAAAREDVAELRRDLAQLAPDKLEADGRLFDEILTFLGTTSHAMQFVRSIRSI